MQRHAQQYAKEKKRKKPISDPITGALDRGTENLGRLQTDSGAWLGDYGGPMFLLPMYVGTQHIAGRTIENGQRTQMVDYFFNVQNADGSMGLHSEGDGSMFTSVLSYIALRLLEVPKDDSRLQRLLSWIQQNGSPLGSATWGKFFLAVLNLYDYQGLHPILPELWLLPRQAPMHPGKLWCHCRQVYLPMAYLYGLKAKAPETAIIRELRDELYAGSYDQIDWPNERNTVAKADSYRRDTKELRWANRAMGVFENHHSATLRAKAQRKLFDHILHEDRATHFIRIGPVNALLNTLVHHFHQPDSADTQKSFQTLEGYLWQGHDGIKMNGYNSSALWDTAFAVQALTASQNKPDLSPTVSAAYEYIRNNQVLEDVPQRETYFRHASRGGWPFSDRKHGWPITDCTAEGLKCALGLETLVDKPIEHELLHASIDLILSFQNPGGGWSTYELQRAGNWIERFNPSQVFGEIMVDYPYVECTSASLQALAKAQKRYPDYRKAEISTAIADGKRFIREIQRQDGSWEGSWAVCFTYGTWFGVWGLLAAGAPKDDPAIRKACRFLERHQNADGGWGEHWTSCIERRWVEHSESQVVQTSWALLTLLHAGLGSSESAHNAAQFLLSKQEADGSWPRESLVGVFNKTTLINYDNYRHYFPLWALGLYAKSQTVLNTR
jgi:squalene/oxidosqualene cyclase-like protein